MSKAVKLSENIRDARRQIQLSHTFRDVSGGDGFAAVATSGTIAALSERGGGISITTQAADNAEGTVTSDGKIAVVADDKPLSFAASLQFSEADTNAGNLFIGLTSEAVATAMGDNGAGPPSNYSGIGFHKVDGGTNWIVEASVGTSQTTQELNAVGSLAGVAVPAGNASYQELEIDVIPKTATVADIIFKIGGSVVFKMTDFTITSMAAMALVAIVKAGGSSAEVLKLRRFDFAQVI